MNRLFLIIFLLFSSTASAKDKVILQLNWFQLADHSVYYLGQHLGYFADENIELEILRGNGSFDSVKKIELQQAHIGIAEIGVQAQAIAKGAQIKTVGVIYDQSINGIFVKASSNIKTPQDLVGKTIAAPSGDAGRAILPSFCRINNINCAKLTLINVQPEVKQVMVVTNQTHAALDGYTGLHTWIKATNNDVFFIDYAKWGVELYGHGYVAHQNLIQSNPNLIARFLKAAYKSWLAAKRDPEKSIAIMSSAPNVPRFDQKIYLQNLELIFDRVFTDRAMNFGLGKIEHSTIISMLDILDIVNVNATDVYTNDFIPKRDSLQIN